MSTLKAQLRRAERNNRFKAFLLTVPVLLFLLITFIYPIGKMLHNGFYNPTFGAVMPQVAQALEHWNPDTHPLPDELTFQKMVEDLTAARKSRTIGQAATRINYDHPGSRSLFTTTSRHAKTIEAPYKDNLIALNDKWSDPRLWFVLKGAAPDYTMNFIWAAMDRRVTLEDGVVAVEEERQIYVKLFGRTLWISMIITGICFLLAFPLSYLLSNLPLRISNLLMICVLLPFWTSLLVRTTAWIAMLQSEGVLNDTAVFLGVIDDDQRLRMIYNQTGTIITMVHILLPFMVLPLYSVMKSISPTAMRAARSLGASFTTAFVKVYFPQTIPGIAAGSLLVFILAVGYYITPALVGGQDGLLISNFIAYHMTKSLNWSLAGALGGFLLAGVLLIYWLYNRLVGIDKLRFN